MSFTISPEIQLWCATRPASLVQMLISPYFIGMLIFMFIFTPFGLIGIHNLWVRLRNWQRTRDGWIRVRKKLSNYHWIVFWAKPTGRKITVRGEEGFEFEIPFQIETTIKKGKKTEKKTENKGGKKIVMMGLEQNTDLAPPK